ncbi:MAG: YicC family protein [Gammaproteobacteria bacterium]|jgi:uncharacterized protein (TIGR00255 family)|nr:YicC family protein [Gammaproteobacteria bacterium]
MISSMTGFARLEHSGSFGQLTCEVRSVNHRYLEPGFRLPEELRALESELRQTLARELRRGKIDCTIHLRGSHEAERELLVDDEAVDRLLARSRDIAERAAAKGLGTSHASSIDPIEVLRWPGVLRQQATETESLHAACRQLFGATVRQLAEARHREGERLQELVEQRCAALTELVATVRARLPEWRQRWRDKLRERLAELAVQVDGERFEQEVALILQRADVDEELDRLDGHLVEIRRVMTGSEAAGRRLDFLMQELNREANTLSSKSQELDTTRIAVDMKVLIEQMREQIQNIE